MRKAPKLEVELAAGLVGPFTAIARVMSNHHRVHIIPSGFRCETDGNVIYIPFAADHLPEDKRQALEGMLDHEVAHVGEEEAHAKVGRTKPTDVMKLAKGKTLRLLLNVVEDIRIERKWAAKYPGVAENLNFLHLDTGAKIRARFADPALPKMNFWNQIGVALLLHGRGEDFTWLEPKVLRALEEVPEEMAAISGDIGWVQDSFDIAERIYAKINRDAEETLEREKRSKDKKKGKGKGASSSGGSAGRGRPSGDEGAEDDSAGGEGDDEETDEGDDGEEDESEGAGGEDDKEDDGEEDGEGAGKGEDEDDEEAPSEEEADEARERLGTEADTEDFTREVKDGLEKDARKDARDHKLYIPDHAVKKLDKWFKPTGSGLANYMRAKEEVNQEIGAIRAKQLAFIQTITRKRLATGRDAGHLDAAVLADVRLGERNVFADIIKGRDLDTAIEVLLDLSGSMGDGDYRHDEVDKDGKPTGRYSAGCAYFCKRIAIALAEAWEPLRIPNEFIGFTNNHGRRSPVRDPDSISRAAFDFYVFKEFGERLKQCRERFTAIKGYHDNADGEAVWAAAVRLSTRPEKRKILLVISDGIPMHSGIDQDMLDKHLRDTVKRITRSGIEVIGVGAGTDAPTKYYNAATGATNLIIRNLNSLPNRLFNTMRERILAK